MRTLVIVRVRYEALVGVHQKLTTPAVAGSVRSRPAWSHTWTKILLATGAILILAALGDVSPRPPVGDSASIAVLPFIYLTASANKDGEIVANGLTEDLIDSLERIPKLHVVAPSSILRYKAGRMDVREAGRQLNARNVLEGSVRIARGHVRISAQLVDTASGYQFWSEIFDCRLDDAITIRRQISTAIMRSIGSQLHPPDSAVTKSPSHL